MKNLDKQSYEAENNKILPQKIWHKYYVANKDPGPPSKERRKHKQEMTAVEVAVDVATSSCTFKKVLRLLDGVL